MSVSEGDTHYTHFKGFDDHSLKQQYSLQRALQQAAPLALDGGREILYWCQSCHTPWYAGGRWQSFTHLSQPQIDELVHCLRADAATPSMLPRALCPDCSGHLFGGIPRIEAYVQDFGYRLSWERSASPALFLCSLYVSPHAAEGEATREALSTFADVPLPSRRIEEVLQWLAGLPDPRWDQIAWLSPEHCELLTRFRKPVPPLAWQGYSWKTVCAPLGGWILAILAVTFHRDSSCSERLLLECWRHIASAMKAAL